MIIRPDMCQRGSMYDYSPCTAITDKFCAEIQANPNRGTLFTTDYSSGNCHINFISGTYTIPVAPTTIAIPIPATPGLNYGFYVQLYVDGGALDDNCTLYFGIWDNALVSIRYGIQFDYSYSADRVRVLYYNTSMLGGYIFNKINQSGINHIVTWERVGALLRVTCNDTNVVVPYSVADENVCVGSRFKLNIYGSGGGGYSGNIYLKGIDTFSAFGTNICMGKSRGNFFLP